MSKFRRALIDTAVITPSGALSPGPLSASAVAAGAGLGVLGGFLVALGHLMVELPYFVALILVMSSVEHRVARVRPLLNIVAGLFILYFAYLLAQTGLELYNGEGLESTGIITDPAAALGVGVMLTGANAYFLAWWFSVGKPIVDSARSLGWRGAAAVYVVHYSYDVGWLVFLAALGGIAGLGGGTILSILMFALSIVLVYYGIKMIAGVKDSNKN